MATGCQQPLGRGEETSLLPTQCQKVCLGGARKFLPARCRQLHDLHLLVQPAVCSDLHKMKEAGMVDIFIVFFIITIFSSTIAFRNLPCAPNNQVPRISATSMNHRDFVRKLHFTNPSRYSDMMLPSSSSLKSHLSTHYIDAASSKQSTSRDSQTASIFYRAAFVCQIALTILGSCMIVLANCIRLNQKYILSVWSSSSLAWDAISALVSTVNLIWIWKTTISPTRSRSATVSTRSIQQYARVTIGIGMIGLLTSVMSSLVAAEKLTRLIAPDLQVGMSALLPAMYSIHALDAFLFLARADLLCCHAITLTCYLPQCWPTAS